MKPVRVIVDMNLSTRVADALCEAGHDAVHVRAAGLGNSLDQAIFDIASRERRAVVTADLDFVKMSALARTDMVSVVLVRLRDPRTCRLINRVLDSLERFGWMIETGALITIDEDRVRVRQLPIESSH